MKRRGPCVGVELLVPRQVPLGGPRAMDVRRTLPQRQRSLIGAWCFLDHYGPDRIGDSGGMKVPRHPHTGLQTVSWLFTGEIEHRDSAGFHAVVRPGEVNLMTAGRGISHSEFSTPDTPSCTVRSCGWHCLTQPATWPPHSSTIVRNRSAETAGPCGCFWASLGLGLACGHPHAAAGCGAPAGAGAELTLDTDALL